MSRTGPGRDPLTQLAADLVAVDADPSRAPRTSKLLRTAVTHMAKKVAEEAVEVAIEALGEDREAVVNEAADLFYNVVVLLHKLGIGADEVWAEMDRRRLVLGIAEKLPKSVPASDAPPGPRSGTGSGQRPGAQPTPKPGGERVQRLHRRGNSAPTTGQA